MKSLRQLIRQPLKTLSGILLVALAVSVLCVSFSQTLAAEDTVAKLKENFVTVALPAARSTSAIEWTDNLAQNGAIVQADIRHGFASAYIPALMQDNETTHLAQTTQRSKNHDLVPEHPVYARAMLEITISKVEYNDGGYEWRYRVTSDSTGVTTYMEGPGDDSYTENDSTSKESSDLYYYTIYGTIDRVIGLEEGYNDPTGYDVTIYFRAAEDQVEFVQSLAVGQKCLVYSDQYLDLDWQLRSSYMNAGRIMFWEEGVEVPDWRNIQVKAELDEAAFYEALAEANIGDVVRREDYMVDIYRVRLGDLYININGNALNMFRTISMTLDNTGIILPIEGTADEFFASEAGSDWLRILDDIEINAHNYPVIATDDLHTYGDFACGRAEVTVGREFTDEEIASGTKVCIISKTLAESNGLGVGDVIDVQFLNYDSISPHQDTIREGEGYINPTAYAYDSASMALTESEGFTIVGLYEQDSPWDNVDYNYYSFTPNTVFMPKTAVTGSMDESDYGMFRTLVLDGDRLREVQIMAAEADMDDALYFYDNGYTKLASSVSGYKEAANQILPLGLLVYGVLMVLYLFLFPGRQGRDLTMMDSMGAPLSQRVRHILLCTLGVLIPGSVLGAAVGIAIWEQVSDALSSYMEAGVDIILDVRQLWTVAAVQSVLIALAAMLIGTIMALNTNYMRRK